MKSNSQNELFLNSGISAKPEKRPLDKGISALIINTTQHNTTQHNTTQHNTTQHNTTQQLEFNSYSDELYPEQLYTTKQAKSCGIKVHSMALL